MPDSSCFTHPSRILVIFVLFSTLIRPFLEANLLDPGKFSETLSELAVDGLGTSTLQVTNKETLFYSHYS